MSPKKQPADDQKPQSGDLKILRDDLDDVVAIAAKLQADARTAEDDTFEGDEIDTIVETTGLTREQLVEAQKLYRAKKDARKTKIVAGVAGLAIAVVLTKGLWWERVFPPDYKALALEAVQLAEKAKNLRSDKKYDDAFKAAKRAVEKDPKNFKAWNMLGLGYEDHDQPAKAQEAYREGIRLAGVQPEAVNLYYNLGTMLNSAPATREEAIGLFKTALTCDPTHASTYNNMGYTYEKMGKVDLAIAAYQASLKYDPTDKTAQDNLSRLMNKSGKTPAAPTQAQVGALGAKLKAVEARDMITKLYRTDKKPKEAIAYGMRAVAQFPDDVQVWNALGLAYEEDAQIVEAARCYTKAIQVGGGIHEACYPNYNLGRLAYDTNDHDTSVKYLKRAIEIYPGHAWSHYYLAREYEVQGKKALAIAEYRSALQADRTLSKAQSGLERLGAN